MTEINLYSWITAAKFLEEDETAGIHGYNTHSL